MLMRTTSGTPGSGGPDVNDVAHGARERHRVHRLGEMPIVAGAQRLAMVGPLREGRERDGRRAATGVRRQPADLADQLVAVDLGHADVADEDVGWPRAKRLEGR